MVIHTIFTCVIRFFRSIRAAFVTESRTNTNDIESGLYESFGVVEFGTYEYYFLSVVLSDTHSRNFSYS
jgi:hypothetical protein